MNKKYQFIPLTQTDGCFMISFSQQKKGKLPYRPASFYAVFGKSK